MNNEISKINASKKALEFITNGMTVGLGTGSTARIFIELLSQKISNDFKITGMPTSVETKKQAKELGIKLMNINDRDTIDLAVDGADEVTKKKNMIKWLGGALLREKIVGKKAKKLIIIADESKIVKLLGRGVLPVEVEKNKYLKIAPELEKLGCTVILRTEDNGKIFETDNRNYIYHCNFDKGIQNEISLEAKLMQIDGVIDTGLFINMADIIIIGTKKGTTIID